MGTAKQTWGCVCVCVYLRASIHTWGNRGDGTHQRPQVNMIRKQCTQHKTLSKKTRNKETETQTYKLDAKEYGVFVDGGEGFLFLGFFFFFFPYTFGAGKKSWLFTFSLWIFGILEWLILNKKVFVGFLPEAPPFGKLFWTESDSTLRVMLVWGHFFWDVSLYI